MVKRVRFAPSPTGSLHIGNALTAVANRRIGDVLLLRIDDTDQARNVPGGEEQIIRELEWLGVAWDEGPVRQSERADAHRAAAARLVGSGRAREEDGAVRFDDERRPTIVRPGGSPTYHLATVVDDIDFGITHVVRGKDHLPNTALHRALAEALGASPPEYIHHGLLVDAEGRKLSKRDELSSLADLREAGIPPEAVRAYLEELGLPRGDVHYDVARIRRLSVEAIAAMSDEELASRAGAPVAAAPALRGARDLTEARAIARGLLEPRPVKLDEQARPTLARFRELRERANGGLGPDEARTLVDQVRAAGGDLRSLRLALTGTERGPELWTVVLALDRDEALRRIDAAL